MSKVIRFGDWQFCPESRSLTRSGETTQLEPLVAGLLACFLAHPGEVLSHDQLVDEVWDGRAVSDEAVRRAVSSLRHALSSDESERPIRTLHKRGYLATFTPAPPEHAVHLPPSPPASAHNGDRRPAWLLVLTMALLAAVAWWWLQRATPAEPVPAQPQPHTLAVLPFVDMSPGGDSQYFSDGLADELRGRLARVNSLRVTARGSSFQFRDAQPDPREVGKALGVAYLLEGSVRREGDRVRITVSLVDAKDGFQLWTEHYERTLADFFAVQEDIATQVTRTLRLVLVDADAPGRETSNTEALLAYLRGRALLASWGEQDAIEAAHQFERAISLDPGYAAAYAQLSEAKMIVASNRGELPKEEESAIEDLVSQALAIDPDLAEAYVARAAVIKDYSVEQWEADLRHAIELNPSYSPAYEVLALGMAEQDRFDEAFRLIDQAIALDPLRARNTHAKAMLHFWQGHLEEAEALENATLRLQPDYYYAHMRLGYINLFRGDFAEAVYHLHRTLAASPRSPFLHDRLASALLAAGDLDSAREEIPHGSKQLIPLLLAQFNGDYPVPDAMLEGSLGSFYPRWMLSDVTLAGALASGNHAHAWALFQKNIDANIRFHAHEDPVEQRVVELYAALLEWLVKGDSGSLARARSLRQALSTLQVPHPSHDAVLLESSRAVAAATLGDRGQALDSLRALLGSGHSERWWWVRTHPAFRELREDPEFRTLLAANEAHAQQQAALLEQMRADGRMPAAGEHASR